MLKTLNIKPLQTRRELARLKMLHEILHKTKIMNAVPKLQRCKDKRFVLLHGSINSYKYSFFPFTINTWNKLPASIINTPDLNKFKNQIENII